MDESTAIQKENSGKDRLSGRGRRSDGNYNQFFIRSKHAGMRGCIGGCGKKFKSPHVRNVQICNPCKIKRGTEGDDTRYKINLIR